MRDRYLIYRAYFHHLQGEPIPVDLFVDLVDEGINPEDLTASFSEGYEPPFDEVEIDEDELDVPLIIDGEEVNIKGLTQEELDELIEEFI